MRCPASLAVTDRARECIFALLPNISPPPHSPSPACPPAVPAACPAALQGSEDQKQELLPAMAKLQLVGCWALTEPSNGSDAAALTCTATKVGLAGLDRRGEGAGSTATRLSQGQGQGERGQWRPC